MTTVRSASGETKTVDPRARAVTGENESALHPLHAASGVSHARGPGVVGRIDSAHPSAAHPLAPWHRTVGNQAVLRILSVPRPTIQTKLKINQPGDQYEQEADRVADKVMRMPEPGAAAFPAASSNVRGVQPKCSRGGSCDTCKAEQGNEHEQLQMKRAGSGDLGQTAVPPIVHEVLRSPGQPLDTATRAFMEPRFELDFSRVRVHSDTTAERSARDVNARAYTVGHDIVFGATQFAPAKREGRRLLAHELTHVVQQRSALMLQREPVDPGATGSSHAEPGQAPCKRWPTNLPTHGTSTLKPAGRDIAIEYSLAVTPGHFCDTRGKSVAVLQYERTVRIRTKSDHEAMLHVVADTAFFPPFDPRKSDFEQLRVPGDVSLRWEVAINFGKGGKGDWWDWGVPPGGEGRASKHPASPAQLESLAQFAEHQPPFVHLFLLPPRQQQALEAFVNQSKIPAKGSRMPPTWGRPRLEGWEKIHPPEGNLWEPPRRSHAVAEQPKEIDDAAISKMSEDERFDLARKKTWEATKAQLKYMWKHPREILKGFAEGALLLNTPELFSAIGEDLTELFDSDANAWARGAAGVEAAENLSGWLSGLFTALGVIASILYVASWLTGIGELVTLGAAATTLFAAALISFVAHLSLSSAKSVLRVKAASKAKTAAEFNRNVESAATGLTSGIVGGALIVATAVLHFPVKALLPKSTPAYIKNFLEGFRKRLTIKGSTKTAPLAPRPAAPTEKRIPEEQPPVEETTPLEEQPPTEETKPPRPAEKPAPIEEPKEQKSKAVRSSSTSNLEKQRDELLETAKVIAEEMRENTQEIIKLQKQQKQWGFSTDREKIIEELRENQRELERESHRNRDELERNKKDLTQSRKTFYDLVRDAVDNDPEFQKFREKAQTEGVDSVSKRRINKRTESITVDHLVSVDEVAKKPGVDRLDPEKVARLLNKRKNLIPMESRANKSKGTRTWAEVPDRDEWQQWRNYYDEKAIKADMAKMENSVREEILAEIEVEIKKLPGGK